MIKKFDIWLGKTLFYPPIIWMCQCIKTAQYDLSRVLWFLGYVGIIYWFEGLIFLHIILGVGGFIFMVSAALSSKHRAAHDMGYQFRILILFLIISLACVGDFGMLISNLIILFAEYAATIRTIPPRKKKNVKFGKGSHA